RQTGCCRRRPSNFDAAKGRFCECALTIVAEMHILFCYKTFDLPPKRVIEIPAHRTNCLWAFQWDSIRTPADHTSDTNGLPCGCLRSLHDQLCNPENPLNSTISRRHGKTKNGKSLTWRAFADKQTHIKRV